MKDEITHNGKMLVEGITWRGTGDGLETQLTVTSDGYQVSMDTHADHGPEPQY